MNSRISLALIALVAVGCSKAPNLHEAEGVTAAVEKLLERVDPATRVYVVDLLPSDSLTADAQQANLRYDEGGTMMFRNISLTHENQMPPRSERMDAYASNTPRPLGEIDFSRVATNVMESTRHLPDDVDFASVASYQIEPRGTAQHEHWVLHTTPKDQSTTTRIGNQIEIRYTEHRFELGADGQVHRVER
jgi:hypothetical protein